MSQSFRRRVRAGWSQFRRCCRRDPRDLGAHRARNYVSGAEGHRLEKAAQEERIVQEKRREEKRAAQESGETRPLGRCRELEEAAQEKERIHGERSSVVVLGLGHWP